MMIRFGKTFLQGTIGRKCLVTPVRLYHFNLLNLKIGYTKEVVLHPESAKLLISQIQLSPNAEGSVSEIKQVCSGLQDKIPLNEFKNQLVVVVDNLKKCKLRGEVSEAMILCGEDITTERVEICQPKTQNDMDLIGHQVVFKNYNPEEPATTRKIKTKEWDDICSRLSVGEDNTIVYKEEETGEEKQLFVVGSSPNDLVPLIVNNLPKGSQVR